MVTVWGSSEEENSDTVMGRWLKRSWSCESVRDERGHGDGGSGAASMVAARAEASRQIEDFMTDGDGRYRFGSKLSRVVGVVYFLLNDRGQSTC